MRQEARDHNLKKVITAWEKGKVENNELFDFLSVSFSKVKRSNEILLSHIWLFLNSNVIEKNKLHVKKDNLLSNVYVYFLSSRKSKCE